MDPKLQIRIQRYGWDAASELYDDGWRGPLAPAQQTLLRVASIKSGERVIEAACGSGLVTRTLAEAVGPAGHVLATDLSQNMVDLTARNSTGYGWDAASELYEDGWRGPLAPAQQTLFRVADIKPGERVIEAACGSGLVTRVLAEAVGPAGYVLATDLSQNMVDLTARHSAGYGRVETARMSADGLAVEPRSFDAAVCALGLMYVPDPGQAAKSMAQAVRPGGRVVATVWGERRNCGWAEIFPIVDARVVSEVCPLFFASGAPGSLKRDFGEAGLHGIEEHRQREVLEFPDERSLL